MGGINYKVISRVVYDFSQVAASQYLEQVVAKAVPVFGYREGTLIARLHTGGTISSAYCLANRSRHICGTRPSRSFSQTSASSARTCAAISPRACGRVRGRRAAAPAPE